MIPFERRVSANSVGDELVVESSGRGGISILTPDANESNVLFGSPSDNLGGFISYKQSTATMEIGTSISSGVFKINSGDGSLGLQIDGNGHVTMPKQSCFNVRISVSQDNITNGSAQTIVFGNEIKDLNGDFSSNTFTAPVTGQYLLTCMVRTDGQQSNTNYNSISITTSNRAYTISFNGPEVWNGASFFTQGGACVADMDANDTAIVTFFGQGGTDATDVTDAHFTGCLLA